MKPSQPMVMCFVCRQRRKRDNALASEFVRESIAAIIRRHHGDLPSDGYICLRDLNHFRIQHIHDTLKLDRGELSPLEKEVIETLYDDEVLTQNPLAGLKRETTWAERLSDRIAEFGGSWGFIITFSLVMVAWVAVNSTKILATPFDPYPYILLNLLLSCLAAMQAPIIMMSQNRKDARDRARAEHDYQINLKAELEIRDLHQKIDQLRTHQWHRLLDLHQSQAELIEQALRKRRVLLDETH